LPAHLDHLQLPCATEYVAQTVRYYPVMDYTEGLDLAIQVRVGGYSTLKQGGERVHR
jgi:hypothetical protein